MNKKIFVLGAGLAGLSAAWKLSEKGFNVEVFDSQPIVGGMCATLKKGQFFLDFAPHEFHASGKESQHIVEEITKLLGNSINHYEKKASVWFGGYSYPYPIKIFDMLKRLDAKNLIWFSLDFIFTRAKSKLSKKSDNSFEDWVKNRYGKSLYEFYFKPYTEKVWGINPKELAPDFASERIPEVSARGIFVDLLMLKATKEFSDHPHMPYDVKPYYPNKGVGLIADKIAEKIKKNKGKISLNSKIVGINLGNKKIESMTFEKNGKKTTIKTDFVISTIPITDFVKMANPKAEKDVLDSANALHYKAMVLLYLTINKPRVSDKQFIYFPEKKFLFNRITEIKNFSEATHPKNKTSLCLEITCDENDAVWKSPAKALYKKVSGDLEKLWEINEKELESVFVIRLPNGYCQWEKNYQKHLQKLNQFIKGIENVSVIGRQGKFKYYNMDQSIKEGFEAAAKIV